MAQEVYRSKFQSQTRRLLPRNAAAFGRATNCAMFQSQTRRLLPRNLASPIVKPKLR